MTLRTLVALFLGCTVCLAQNAAPQSAAQQSVAPQSLQVSNTTVPRVDNGPSLDVFNAMKPAPEWEGKLAKISGFIQRDPKDSAPALSRTDVYLAYDSTNFYAVFVCFDDQPKTIRSRRTRRDNIGPEDDEVQIYLDTFNDHRRSYGFMTNPQGIQFDYLWSEERGYDQSWDTVWQSAGKRTEQGWIGLFAIPFKSLRFSTTGEQTWGILLQRVVPRTNENLFWPKVSHAIQGRLTQEGQVTGLENISPGRNLQFIPYAIGRSFRAPDLRDPSAPRFGGARLRGQIGLDAKAVIKDSFVLDATLKPDFSQVESDEPQVTANQRFEVFFPEKRPFFMENSDYFSTPINLLFTRRIAAPEFGVRLTGKKGPYSIGMLFADDRSPGLSRPDADPLHKARAYFGIFRAKREFFKQSNIGVMYTQRQFQDSFNRVSGLDGRFKWREHWTLDYQGVFSNTRFLGATKDTNGTAYQTFLDYSSLHLQANTMYTDNSKNFLTQTGFFRRQDIRRWSNDLTYTFRPEGKILITHAPELFTESIWDHSGLRLTGNVFGTWHFNLPRNTQISPYFQGGHERLRPIDFPALVSNQDLRSFVQGINLRSFYFPKLSIFADINWGTGNNFVAANGIPNVARVNNIFLQTTVKPISPLTIDNTYILTRLRDYRAPLSVFNDHILRTKWNYQFTRELSLRFIMQYNSLLGNPTNTFLSTNKGLNSDVLITWLLHPGTAVYVGYNTNLSNPTPVFLPVLGGPGTPDNRFVNDARGVFVKASWLFRF